MIHISRGKRKKKCRLREQESNHGKKEPKKQHNEKAMNKFILRNFVPGIDNGTGLNQPVNTVC